jgi:transketolase
MIMTISNNKSILEDPKKLRRLTAEIRRDIVEIFASSGTSHIGSALSIVEILTALYFHILRVKPEEPQFKSRDRFVLSKGHACAALYATLAHRGFFDRGCLKTYCSDGSKLPGHVTLHTVPGVEVTTGSLGHGLSIGAGMALASKYDGTDSRVFILLSDGECDEGSTWEAAMFTSHHKLDNMVTIIDYNKLQSFGRVAEVLELEPFTDKWRAFQWAVREVNGHDLIDLIRALEDTPFEKDKPSVLIAHTIKGKGVSFMEDKLEWHYKSPDQQQAEMALKELERYEESIH